MSTHDDPLLVRFALNRVNTKNRFSHATNSTRNRLIDKRSYIERTYRGIKMILLYTKIYRIYIYIYKYFNDIRNKLLIIDNN